MTSNHIPMDYKELIRDFHPKRDQMNKIHRWRHTTLEDDLIVKVVYIDGLKKDEILENDIYEKTAVHLNNDWTNMKFDVLYSLKKQNRWELPDIIERNLPKFEDGFQIPLPVTGTSLARFQNYRTHGYSPRCWYSQDMKYYGRRVNSLTLLDRKGERKAYPGTMNKGNIRDILRSLKYEEEAASRTIHIQFQTLEFKLVPRKHNSRKYDYRSGRCRYDEEPIFNASIIREEFPFCECSGYCTACNGMDARNDASDCDCDGQRKACSACEGPFGEDYVWDSDEELECECETNICAKCVYYPPRNITVFGDFFNVHNIPQERRSKKRDLKDWMLL